MPGFRGEFGRVPFPLWQRAVLFGFAYFVCAEAGRYLSAEGETYVSFWLPAGLYVAVLLLNERRDWPWLALAAFPANVFFDLLHHTPLVPALFFYCANTLQSVVGAWLIQRFVAKRPTLATVKEFVGLIGIAGMLGTALGATIGAATLFASGLSNSFVQSWKVWWGSCVMAVLVLSPFILTWFNRSNGWSRESLAPKRIAEVTLLLLGLALITWCTLTLDRGIMSPNKGLFIPFLLWAGLRFGARGATAVQLLLSSVMAFFTTHLLTGLSSEDISSGAYVFTLQNSIAMAALVGLIPAIVVGERDQTLARLRESEEHFRHLTQAAFEGIGISENGRVVDVNDQMLAMFGYERHEMIGREVIDLVEPESRSVVAEAIRTGQESIYEHRLLRKDGSFFFAEARAKMVRVGSRTLRMTALRDITARKQAEEALSRAREMALMASMEFTQRLISSEEQERKRLADELHDSLGQNLSLIKNRVHLALQQPGMPSPAAGHVEAIGKTVTDAIAEVRNLAHNLRPLNIDKFGLTDSLQNLVEEVALSSSIRFKRRFENVDDLFQGEEATIIYRIVQESLNNLIKHSQATRATVMVERDLRCARIRVEDNGRGFEMTGVVAVGKVRTGIGLTSISERVRMLHGSLVIQSAPGQGTRIKIEIPIPEMDGHLPSTS